MNGHPEPSTKSDEEQVNPSHDLQASTTALIFRSGNRKWFGILRRHCRNLKVFQILRKPGSSLFSFVFCCHAIWRNFSTAISGERNFCLFSQNLSTFSGIKFPNFYSDKRLHQKYYVVFFLRSMKYAIKLKSPPKTKKAPAI